jgi:hypothetical protein
MFESIETYLKQFVPGQKGIFTVCRVSAESRELLDAKLGVYRGDGWETATEEEYASHVFVHVRKAEESLDVGKTSSDEQSVNDVTSEENKEVLDKNLKTTAEEPAQPGIDPTPEGELGNDAPANVLTENGVSVAPAGETVAEADKPAEGAQV